MIFSAHLLYFLCVSVEEKKSKENEQDDEKEGKENKDIQIPIRDRQSSATRPRERKISQLRPKTNIRITTPINLPCCRAMLSDEKIFWLNEKTQEMYCEKCSTLLQFSECIRKYVLESENQEVVDFLWPLIYLCIRIVSL